MAIKTSPVEIPAHLRPVVQAAAKNLLHHLYGPQGLPWGTSFADLEELVVQLRDCLGSELLQQSLQHQAEQPPPQPLQPCPGCGRLTRPGDPEPRTVRARIGTANWQEPSSPCDHCRKAFFPQSKSLGIDRGSFSPGVLKKIVYAGSNHPSFESARQSMRFLAEATVAVKQIERLTQQIGKERQDERDAAVAAYLARPLAQREEVPPGVTPPPLAVAEMDGGRLQIRRADDPPPKEAEAGPTTAVGSPTTAAPLRANDLPPSPGTAAAGPPERIVKSKHWREDKVGCLLEMSSEVSDSDPCSEIPTVFVDPLGALKLAQEIGHCTVPAGTPFQRAEPAAEEAPHQDESPKRPGRPEIDKRHIVASRQDIDGFGPLLAATAGSLGLFGAARRAFVADGSAENWSVYKRYFSRWTAVLDFVHALTYVYAAAMAGRKFAEGWPVYEQWIRWVWGGLVSKVIEALTTRQAEVGEATSSDPEGSPRRVIQEALTYLGNHQQKMRYDEYRRQGLPLMSSHVESTVKQINYRVKGTEKFWSEPGAEALLQLRADYLSDDEPMEDFWQRRQAAATGQRRYRQRAA